MRKRCKVSRKNVEGWLNDGFGQGEGIDYRPFFHVRDVPSTGRSSMVFGLKTGRIHHYLSDAEYSCHLLAEFSPFVIDIREQFALLPWDVTQQIANEIGVRHPTYPGSKTPTVMTSDLVLTISHNSKLHNVVLSVKGEPLKPVQESRKNKRTVEKLAIEKAFWASQGVLWKLITKNQLPMTRIYNLDFLRGGLIGKNEETLPSVNQFSTYFLSVWTPQKTINELILKTAKFFDLSMNESFFLLAKSIWTRVLPVDLDKARLHHDAPLMCKSGRGERTCWILTLFSEPHPIVKQSLRDLQGF
ncbi:TnsA endonuclease N-terminal domain-containing protein [Desulfuromonas acetoxidans]|uniref:TnsA endonuclease N-terminal domain-containing protein n=1 Tax=Desulfuromonas acetoxidans TaxID=891 RepID=UPI0029317DBD|nr:TnsA endonuclease N-terminal domain-containing protein [Desulfuromonas acetoxidans]